MKSVFISELADGDDLLNEPFLLEDVVRRETKDGRPYLLATFRDKSGAIGGVFWDVPDDIDTWVRPGLATLVTGRISSYKNSLQIAATDLNVLNEPNMGDFLPASGRSTDEMIAELRQVVEGLSSPYKELVSHLLLDPPLLSAFARAPAARNLHHAFVGGLLEHTLSMSKIAMSMAEQYPYVNLNLLLTGTLFHDLGKVFEYSTDATFDFTDDGRLVGHIVRAVIMVEKAAAETNFPDEQLRQVIHLIVSHHGIQEWGSPVVPKTLEAILLHQIDLLDSRVQGFFDHLRSDNSGETWTSRQSYMFSTELRRPPGFE